MSVQPQATNAFHLQYQFHLLLIRPTCLLHLIKAQLDEGITCHFEINFHISASACQTVTTVVYHVRRPFFLPFRRFCYWFSPTYIHTTCNTLLCHTFIFHFNFFFFFFWVSNCICLRPTMRGRSRARCSENRRRRRRKKPRDRFFLLMWHYIAWLCVRLWAYKYSQAHANIVVWLHSEKLRVMSQCDPACDSVSKSRVNP